MDKNASKPAFPYVATIVAFSAVVIMLGLGFWQLDRKAEKDARLAHIENAKLQHSVTIRQVQQDPIAYQDYTVTLTGYFASNAFYIDNKMRQGRAGFHVLVPFTTNRGTVMLNLGWISSTGVRTQLPTFTLPQPSLQITKVNAIVYIPLNNTLVTETNSEYGQFPVLLQQVDLAEIEKHLKKDVEPFVGRIIDGSDDVFIREWELITMSPEKHLGYAVQWFGLAIAALTIYLLNLLKRLRAPHAKNDDTPDN